MVVKRGNVCVLRKSTPTLTGKPRKVFLALARVRGVHMNARNETIASGRPCDFSIEINPADCLPHSQTNRVLTRYSRDPASSNSARSVCWAASQVAKPFCIDIESRSNERSSVSMFRMRTPLTECERWNIGWYPVVSTTAPEARNWIQCGGSRVHSVGEMDPRRNGYESAYTRQSTPCPIYIDPLGLATRIQFLTMIIQYITHKLW